jgi:hypothetical protein
MRFVLSLASGFLASLTFAQAKNPAAITPTHIELPLRYENVARAARLQGVVTVRLTVSSDGKVIAAEAKTAGSKAMCSSTVTSDSLWSATDTPVPSEKQLRFLLDISKSSQRGEGRQSKPSPQKSY